MEVIESGLHRGREAGDRAGLPGAEAARVSWACRRSVKITDAAVLKRFANTPREAGVRNLEREIASMCRKIARKVATASDSGEEAPSYVIDAADITTYLGPERFCSAWPKSRTRSVWRRACIGRPPAATRCRSRCCRCVVRAFCS